MDSQEISQFKEYVAKRVQDSEADIEVEKLIQQFAKFCPSPQSTTLENAKEIINELVGVIEKTMPVSVAKENEAEKKRREKEELDKIIQEANNKVVCDNRDIRKYYERLRKSVEMVAKAYFNCTFLKSSAGLGKSYQVTATLNDMGMKSGTDYVEFAGDISPAYIYRFVLENNGKIIIFRDTARLIQELRSIDMLKAMTETHGDRIVRRAIYGKDFDDLPCFFKCESGFIFEFNNLHFNGLKEDLEALISRGDFVSVVFSMQDIANIMMQIATTTEQKEVTEFLLKHYRYIGMNALNLRTQHKAFQIYNYSQKNGSVWQEEIVKFLTSEMTATRKMLYGLIGDRAVRSADLKRLLVVSQIDNISHLRTADRRIRDWVMLRELFIVGFVCDDDEELERYLNTHKNFAVSINPIEAITLQENATNTTTLQIKTPS